MALPMALELGTAIESGRKGMLQEKLSMPESKDTSEGAQENLVTCVRDN